MADKNRILKTTARVIATLVVVAIAGVLAWFAWQHYVYAPWTRDARVQADVVNIAPEVSGTVVKVAVADDSFVHKGDLLFRIEPVRFKHRVEEAKANLESARARRAFTQANARRLERLPPGGVSTQELQRAQSNAQEAVAAVSQYEAQLAQARQNLDWTTVSAPATGYVTHLQLDEGDYATEGTSALTLVNVETFRVIGYFEETKLANLAVGDPVDITLMAGDTHLDGHVASVGRGIAIDNFAPGERNLPTVNPVFQWVRLAQRVPVTIVFDKRPATLPLSIGLTATVHVRPEERIESDQRQPILDENRPLRWNDMAPRTDTTARDPS